MLSETVLKSCGSDVTGDVIRSVECFVQHQPDGYLGEPESQFEHGSSIHIGGKIGGGRKGDGVACQTYALFIILLSNVNIFTLVALEGSIQSGLAAEGPDWAYVQDIEKFLQMKRFLDTEKVLLLRSPPGSGTTTLLFTLAHISADAVSLPTTLALLILKIE